ncbi:MAG: hypothetical protein WDM79_07520 [Terricaulis sp.]
MKQFIAAALGAACFASFAFAAGPSLPPANPKPQMSAPIPAPVAGIPDGRSVATDAEVGEARREYRAQCGRVESDGFCECVTAGVAQALAPADVRLAASTLGERLGAEGDAAAGAVETDQAPGHVDSMTRIEQVEAHYADACAATRGTPKAG